MIKFRCRRGLSPAITLLEKIMFAGKLGAIISTLISWLIYHVPTLDMGLILGTIILLWK